MQVDGEETSFHSCFESLKSAVMGCCYSICHKENDPQDNIPGVRTPLLEQAQQSQETPPPAAAATPPRKHDDQTLLNRILHETAVNVIDVGALGPYALEPGVYNERVRAYTARVANAQPPAHTEHRLLADVTSSDKSGILSKPGLSGEDREFISNFVRKAAAAISELRVEHHEDLVVPFRVP